MKDAWQAGSGEHTPTPWRADITAHRTVDGTSCVAFIVNEKTNIADVCSSYNISTEEAIANAAFIVLACNSHASLSAEKEALQTERDEAVTLFNKAGPEMMAAIAERDRLSAENATLRACVAEAADLLIAINKNMHARNPMAVTAIDTWLANRALAPDRKGP